MMQKNKYASPGFQTIKYNLMKEIGLLQISNNLTSPKQKALTLTS